MAQMFSFSSQFFYDGRASQNATLSYHVISSKFASVVLFDINIL